MISISANESPTGCVLSLPIFDFTDWLCVESSDLKKIDIHVSARLLMLPTLLLQQRLENTMHWLVSGP